LIAEWCSSPQTHSSSSTTPEIPARNNTRQEWKGVKVCFHSIVACFQDSMVWSERSNSWKINSFNLVVVVCISGQGVANAWQVTTTNFAPNVVHRQCQPTRDTSLPAWGDHNEPSPSSLPLHQRTTLFSPSIFPRRKVLTNVVAVTSSLSVLLAVAPSANAAGPVTAKDTDSFGARLQRATRPKPPKLLRPKMKLEFAVLLMRSSYQALDQIDCVAMVRFATLRRPFL
jgi:hypothetical protein